MPPLQSIIRNVPAAIVNNFVFDTLMILFLYNTACMRHGAGIMPVPQLYVERRGGTITHRNKEQKGFDKFNLEPNEERRVTFTLGFDELKEWSMNKKYELLGQRIKIMVGTSCQDIVFESSLTI